MRGQVLIKSGDEVVSWRRAQEWEI